MEIDAIIRMQVETQRSCVEYNQAAREKADIWISTVSNAPRSIDAIQSLMDAKEVAMNKTDNVVEIRRLDWEWSALQWLQSMVRQTQERRLADA